MIMHKQEIGNHISAAEDIRVEMGRQEKCVSENVQMIGKKKKKKKEKNGQRVSGNGGGNGQRCLCRLKTRRGTGQKGLGKDLFPEVLARYIYRIYTQGDREGRPREWIFITFIQPRDTSTSTDYKEKEANRARLTD